MKYPTIAVLLILLYFAACTPESCLEETESFLEASFYSYATGGILAPDSLTLYGTGRDTSMIYSSLAAVKIASIPLNPAETTSSFVIMINGVEDTLVFSHFSYPHLISRECGYTFYHNLDSMSFTKNAIDSVWIRNNIITTFDEENIRIFY